MKDLSVNFQAAQDLAAKLLAQGSDAFVVCGTTGESPTVTKDEKLKLFSAIKEVTKDKGLMIAGTSSYDTQASVELTKKAEAMGADAILAVTPYYNKPPQAGLIHHFTAIAEATALPVILYNVPPRTNVNIEPATVAQLSKVDNIVAVKEAAGSMDQVSQIRSLVDEDFLVYSGDDSLTLPMLSLGAKGVISVASHIIGDGIKEMVTAYQAGDKDKALALHMKYYPVFRKLFITANPIPLKYALNRIGFPAGPCRLPLPEVTEAEAAVLDEMLTKIGLI